MDIYIYIYIYIKLVCLIAHRITTKDRITNSLPALKDRITNSLPALTQALKKYDFWSFQCCPP